MSDVSLQVVGVIRFSVLAEGFAISLYGGMDKLREYLFARESLDFRFYIFENLCLPSLLAQTDQNFDIVLLTSTELPDWARRRMDEIVAPYPNIHVLAEAPNKHNKVVRAAYESIPHEGFSHRAAFRLDNDDALHNGFVAHLRKLSHGLLKLHDDDVPTIIAFNHGFYIELDSDGPNKISDTIEREPLSTGTTLLSRADFHLNPYRFNHRAVAQHFNTYTEISVPGFLRTVHGENEQRVLKRGRQNEMPPRRIRRVIEDNFAFSFADLQGLKGP